MEKLKMSVSSNIIRTPQKKYFQQLIQLEAFNIICSQRNKFVIVVYKFEERDIYLWFV